jgi:tetratricopeptide (TPR) repeat protein
MISEETKKLLEFYNKGLQLYRERKFDEALTFFEKALEVNPEDGPSKLYVERCKMLKESPPPVDWDGVFTMTTK